MGIDSIEVKNIFLIIEKNPLPLFNFKLKIILHWQRNAQLNQCEHDAIL